MQKATKSVLLELDEMLLHRDKQHLIENRAVNVITSAINLINLLKENYDEEFAGELERRLISSIKAQDANRFVRGIRKNKE